MLICIPTQNGQNRWCYVAITRWGSSTSLALSPRSSHLLVVLSSTSKRAGVFMLMTGGRIDSNSEGKCTCKEAHTSPVEKIVLNVRCRFLEVFEVACKIHQEIEMHPFAFRAHAHKLGETSSSRMTKHVHAERANRTGQFRVSSSWPW